MSASPSDKLILAYATGQISEACFDRCAGLGNGNKGRRKKTIRIDALMRAIPTAEAV
jgi:hypothetical protein